MAMINEVSRENRKFGMNWVDKDGAAAGGTPRADSPASPGGDDSVIDVDI